MKRALTLILAALAALVPVVNYAVIANLPAPVIPVRDFGGLSDDHRIGSDVEIADPMAARPTPTVLPAGAVPRNYVVVGSQISRAHAEAKKGTSDFKDKVVVVPVQQPPPELPSPPPFEFIPHVPVVSP